MTICERTPSQIERKGKRKNIDSIGRSNLIIFAPNGIIFFDSHRADHFQN